MSERLASSLEVSGLCRRAEAQGGFAAVVRHGDADRGTILILASERGAPCALLERRMDADFRYRWSRSNLPQGDLAGFIGERAHSDPDFWLIELDIPDAERFVAEMTSTG